MFVTTPDGVPSGTPTWTVTVQVAPAASGSIPQTMVCPSVTHAPGADDRDRPHGEHPGDRVR